jgi:branched-chain amino acid transport system ATP-binding protein
MTLLEIRGITKHFGGLTAVNNLDLDVYEGEILGLIGPNGAGKTTTFNLITGFIKTDAGKILFNKIDISHLKPYQIAKQGIIRTFQASSSFKEYTVQDNILVAQHLQRKKGFLSTLFATPSSRREDKDMLLRSRDILGFVGMHDIKEKMAGECSSGYQKTLSIAMALSANPKLLLLDEPVAALNPERVKTIIDLIRKFRDSGTTILIIEHNMRTIFNLCDRIVVLNYGSKIAEGNPTEVKNNEKVIKAYLGETRYAA